MRPYTTDLPARRDLAFRSNDDKLVGVVWLKSDGVTPVPVAVAKLTLELDDAAPLAEPPVPATIHELDADPDGFALGQVLVTVPHTLWDGSAPVTGNWDLLAVSDTGLQRCLMRGLFALTDGVST